MFSLIFFCPADHVSDWQPRKLLLFETTLRFTGSVPADSRQ